MQAIQANDIDLMADLLDSRADPNSADQVSQHFPGINVIGAFSPPCPPTAQKSMNSNIAHHVFERRTV